MHNSKNQNLDDLSTLDILKLMNNADSEISAAIFAQLDNINLVIDEIINKLSVSKYYRFFGKQPSNSARLIYIGAGTSGRIGVLDASECPPTFGCSPDLIYGMIAGGDAALRKSVEGAEDNMQQAILDLKNINFSKDDVLLGIASSGSTPYVLSAIGYANDIGAMSIGLSCTADSDLSKLAKYQITPVVGGEVLLGSSRLKAGSACKMILNMISTTVMSKLGSVYGNYMVDCQVSNKKLYRRGINMVKSIASVSEQQAEKLLKLTNGNIKLAIICHVKSLDIMQAKELLGKNNNNLRKIIG